MPPPVHQIKSVSQYHHLLGLPPPEHPHFSVIELESVKFLERASPLTLAYEFYIIFLKRDPQGKFTYRYGQRPASLAVAPAEQDFETSWLFFMAPGQVLGVEHHQPEADGLSGWAILLHPDYLWNTRLAKVITQHEFFHYSSNEALHLAPQEEKKVVSIIRNIQDEYTSKIDRYSQEVVLAELELLFTHVTRFYNRQFVTRKITHHGVLERLETLLNSYFNSPQLPQQGLPTVQYLSSQLHISPTYLRALLKALTGLNTQEHIHRKLIEQAKEKLATTELSVSQIAYELGFEHAPSFSKFFKSKTHCSPVSFRQSL